MPRVAFLHVVLRQRNAFRVSADAAEAVPDELVQVQLNVAALPHGGSVVVVAHYHDLALCRRVVVRVVSGHVERYQLEVVLGVPEASDVVVIKWLHFAGGRANRVPHVVDACAEAEEHHESN